MDLSPTLWSARRPAGDSSRSRLHFLFRVNLLSRQLHVYTLIHTNGHVYTDTRPSVTFLFFLRSFYHRSYSITIGYHYRPYRYHYFYYHPPPKLFTSPPSSLSLLLLLLLSLLLLVILYYYSYSNTITTITIITIANQRVSQRSAPRGTDAS